MNRDDVHWANIIQAVRVGLSCAGIEKNQLKYQETAKGIIVWVETGIRVMLVPKRNQQSRWDGEIEIYRWWSENRRYEFQQCTTTVDGIVSAIVFSLLSHSISKALVESGLSGMLAVPKLANQREDIDNGITLRVADHRKSA